MTRENFFEIRSMDYAHLTRPCKSVTPKQQRELYKLRLVKLHGHEKKKTILWKKNGHSRLTMTL